MRLGLTDAVQPGEGRVMTVFIAQGRMRWPLRCRAQELADCGWNVREPRDKGHQTTARPGGRSKCMSGRQSVRTRRRVGESDNSWGHAASRKVHPRAERRRFAASTAIPQVVRPCWIV